jgi:hypothetical protein
MFCLKRKMYRRIKKRKSERDRPEQRSLFDGTSAIVRCFIGVAILASSVVEATVPALFQSEPNLQKSSNTERITSDTFGIDFSNGNADGYDETTDGESLSDQIFETASSSSAGEDTTSSTTAFTGAGSSTLWQQRTPEFVGLIVLGGLVLVLCCVLTLYLLSIGRHTGRKKRKKDTATMFSYMNELNVEDLDIRRSPAGGYLVTYMHGLANGENSMADYDGDEQDN